MTHSSRIVIQALGLSKQLDGRRVLREIDLEIAAGECVALMGGNGEGKTTLLRCLAAIARPTSGEVRWFGRPAAADPAQRRRIGIVGHESGMYAHLTLRENLRFAARMCQLADGAELVDKLLEQTGLRSLAGRQVRQVSQGMRQRLKLARALIHSPSILLLDEPFSGLDDSSRDWLAALLQERRSAGCAICFSTHDEEHSRQLADRVLILRNGSLSGHQVVPRCSSMVATCRCAS